MNLKLSKDFQFPFLYKKTNIFSLIIIFISIIFLIFKGLNLGIDFKGGTLIEIKTEDSSINISQIRQSFLKMNIGDVNVKNFGSENDYLVKIELSKSNDTNFINSIKKQLSNDLGNEINFRREERIIDLFLMFII